MYKDDATRVRHIRDAALEAVGFIKGRSRSDLDTDRQLSLSLIHLLEIIGKAASGVSDEYCKNHPHVPWSQMIRMRNRLIHGYFDINLDVVWQTVTEDMPVLLDALPDTPK
jgi:uncharacterized protein with HEPN domain